MRQCGPFCTSHLSRILQQSFNIWNIWSFVFRILYCNIMALRYVGHSEINASTQVSHASGVTLKRYLCEIVHCSLRFNFPWGKRTALRCIRLSKRIKQRAVNEFLTQGNETPTGNYRWLLVFYGKNTMDMSTARRWIIKSKNSEGNLDLNDQPLFGSPVTSIQYEQATKLNRQRTYSRKSTKINSET